LDGLANYIAAHAREFLAPTPLHCRLETPLESGELILSAQQRHHLFLAFKEALTNVVRHAGATQVAIELQVRDGALLLVVSDNGVGLSGAQPGRGRRGLNQMRQRLETIGGTCEISNAPGGGTTVRLKSPLQARAFSFPESSPSAPDELK
jgi:signal transduction histidine kinase